MQGLVARRELNGLAGTLVGFSGDQGRWQAVLDNGTGVSLCSANAEVIPDSYSEGDPIRIMAT